jgi:hypothetical protein
MIVAMVALVVALGGTAYAAVSGDSVINRHSLSGNRLRNHTVTNTQVAGGTVGLNELSLAAQRSFGTRFWAKVGFSGTTPVLVNQVGATGISRVSGAPAGAFLISFNRSQISTCSYLGTINDTGTPDARILVGPSSTSVQTVSVRTLVGTTDFDKTFTVSVLC